jgi:hypothetical protein
MTEIASQERLPVERVRKIVRQAFERRIVDDGAEHAKLQLTRLRPTMRLASDAIASGDIKAIGPLLKELDRLDHYHKAAMTIQADDDEARRKLLDKLNQVAANLGLDEASAAAKAGEAAKGTPAGGGAPGSVGASQRTLASPEWENAPGVRANR